VGATVPTCRFKKHRPFLNVMEPLS
jgi:hypothetical protein